MRLLLASVALVAAIVLAGGFSITDRSVRDGVPEETRTVYIDGIPGLGGLAVPTDSVGCRTAGSTSGASDASLAGTLAYHSDDVFWDGRFFPPGTDRGWRVETIVVDSEDRVYIGGQFLSAGQAFANHVAMWDGSRWNALGSGVREWSSGDECPSCTSVYRLLIDRNGDLIAIGDFDFADDVPVDNRARWNGSSWTVAGSYQDTPYPPFYVDENLVDGTVRAYATYRGGENTGAEKSYIAGLFSSIDGVPVENVAVWDGSRWEALGAGLNGQVDALTVDEDGTLFAGGAFDSAGGEAAKSIARWDGTSWSPLAEGIWASWGNNILINALSVDSDNNLYVGGLFNRAGAVVATNIARWDGTSWSTMTGERSMGRPKPDDTYIRPHAAGSENEVLFVVRRQSVIDGSPYLQATERIVEWKDEGWSDVVDLTGATDEVNTRIYATALDASGRLYVGGSSIIVDAKGTRQQAWIASWDGSSWASLGSEITGERISALALDDQGALYAGGTFYSAGGNPANNVAKWNGSEWSSLGEGIKGGYVSVLAVEDLGTLYAAGGFDTAGGNPASRIAKWDGTAWTALGKGFNGDGVSAMALDNSGNLFVAGDGTFEVAEGENVEQIASWDGSSWAALGEGPGVAGERRVGSLSVDPTTGWVYAGGKFNSPDGASRNIARWDGTSWSNLGSGVSWNQVSSVAVGGNGDVWISGQFFVAGDKPSDGIARWDAASATASSETENPPLDKQEPFELKPAYPNPFSLSTSLELKAWTPERIEVAVYDISGRHIRQLFGGMSKPNRIQHIRLNGGDLPAGAYFVRVVGETFSTSRVVVRVP